MMDTRSRRHHRVWQKNIGRKILDACEMCEAKSIYRKEPESLYVTDIVFSIPGYFSQALQNN